MSKDKGSKTLKGYFLLGVVILFLGILYLFLSGNLSFNKGNWFPTFNKTSTPFAGLGVGTNGSNPENKKDTSSPYENIDTSSLQHLPLKGNSDQPQETMDRLDTASNDQKDDKQTEVASQISQQPSKSTNEQSQETSNQQLTYKLPDGIAVNISPNSFAHKFQQALENKVVGKPFIFDRVYFSSGSDKLDKQSNKQISETAVLLNTYSDINIAIRGHSDNKGSSKKNTILSLLRSGNMKKALINLGIDHKRIQIEGIGSQEPIASNKTKRGRRNNRRIDLIIKK